MNNKRRQPIVYVFLFFLLIFSRQSSACSINVIDAQYTTFLSTTVFSMYGDTRTDVSRTNTSLKPISDSLDGPSHNDWGVVAEANADLFKVDVFTGISGHDENVAVATAQSEITFSPLENAFQTIDITFMGWYEWVYSDGFVSLFDITSNQELWNYSWNYWDQYPDTVPWEDDITMDPRATAALSLNTYFDTTHVYELNMYSWVCSNPLDSERITIELTGLNVPEPSIILLLGFGLVGLAGFRRKA